MSDCKLQYADDDDQIVDLRFAADGRKAIIAKAKRLLVGVIKSTGSYSIMVGYIFVDGKPFGTLGTLASPSIVSPASVSFDDGDALMALAA